MLKEIGLGIVGFFALITVYCTAVFISQKIRLRKFRGPLAIPLAGNFYTYEALFFLRYMVSLRKRHGKIFTFFGLMKPFLVVCDPVVVRRILSDSKTFYKGTDYSEHFSIAFGKGLVTSNGDKHKKDRGVFGKYFIRSNISKYAKLINEVCDQAIEQILVRKDGKKNIQNIEHFFATVALRVFMSFSIGTDYRSNPAREKELCHKVSRASLCVARVIAIGLPNWSWIPWVKEIHVCRESVLRDFKPIIAERKAQMARGEGPEVEDCLTAMINDNMEEDDMADHFMTLICAGHDTTSYFSSYLMLLLAQNQPAQQKLYDEIQESLKDVDDITADHVTELKYLNKVMQEALRLYAIIPQVTRVSAEEVHIKEANITIPKGVNCLIPMFLINRDPEIWDNPAEFMPERFDGRSNVDFTSAKNGFFPFGYGSRTCIGNTLAQIESSIFVVKLLKKFKFEEDPGFRPSIMSGISLTTSNGINVSLVERNA